MNKKHFDEYREITEKYVGLAKLALLNNDSEKAKRWLDTCAERLISLEREYPVKQEPVEMWEDRMGGQFTQEEINRGWGSEGW